MAKGAKRLTTADLVVLALLHERPMHGYELVATLEQRDFEDWAPISRPQVYYSLRKLREQRFIRPITDKSPALGPNRVVFKPSRKATDAMRRALATVNWTNRRPPSPFCTWTVLASHASATVVKQQFRRRTEFLRQEIKRETNTLLTFDDSDPGQLARALVSLTIHQFRLELEALGEMRKAVLAQVRHRESV
jgi:DNA-binding PadR family transcriptional regulator